MSVEIGGDLDGAVPEPEEITAAGHRNPQGVRGTAQGRSLLLVGATGTGKTRRAHGAVRSGRRSPTAVVTAIAADPYADLRPTPSPRRRRGPVATQRTARLFRGLNALVPQLSQDRVLHGGREFADPLSLIQLFGISDTTAMRYISAVHRERTARLPRWARGPGVPLASGEPIDKCPPVVGVSKALIAGEDEWVATTNTRVKTEEDDG